jgi:hypothetical protein
MPDADNIDFMDFDPNTNVLTIFDDSILEEHEGQWLITFEASFFNPDTSATNSFNKSFVVNIRPAGYDENDVILMRTFDFSKSFQSFVSSVSDEGLVGFGFTAPPPTTGTRNLSAKEEVIFSDQKEAAVFE